MKLVPEPNILSATSASNPKAISKLPGSVSSSKISESPASDDEPSVPSNNILPGEAAAPTVEIVPVSVFTSPKVEVKSTSAVKTALLSVAGCDIPFV